MYNPTFLRESTESVSIQNLDNYMFKKKNELINKKLKNFFTYYK